MGGPPEIQGSTLEDWEAWLLPQARRVVLLGEIDIQPDQCDRLGRLIGEHLHGSTFTSALESLSQSYRGCFAVFLVAQGVYGYERGGYWPGVARALQKEMDGNVENKLGELFEEILRRLGKPLFPDLGGRRFVGLILLHGGVPSTCLPDFFANMLWPAVARSGSADMQADELIDDWLHVGTGRWLTDKPVLDFLEFGGLVAENLVDRCLTMARQAAETGSVPASGDVGLPKRIVEAFGQWVSRAQRETPEPAMALRRPQIWLDPWGLGVQANLPPQTTPAAELRSAHAWRIEAGGETRVIGVGVRKAGPDWKTTQESVPLPEPAPEYLIAYMIDGQERRTWRIPGVDPVRLLLAFAPAPGGLVHWVHSLPARVLTLLCPRDSELEIDGEARHIERLPDLPWGWGEYRAGTWDLTKATRVRLVDEQGDLLTLQVRPDETAERAHLEGGVILSPEAAGIRPPAYVGAPPRIVVPLDSHLSLDEELWRWRLSLQNRWPAVPDRQLRKSLAEMRPLLEIGGGYAAVPLALPSMLGAEPLGNFEARLRGPLGRDVSFALRIAPRLEVTGHEELYLPDTISGPAPVHLLAQVARGDRLECQAEGGQVQLRSDRGPQGEGVYDVEVDADATSVELTVARDLASGDVARAPFHLPIRRLRWTRVDEAVESSALQWSGRTLLCCLEELRRAGSPALLFELPIEDQEDVRPALRLLDGNGVEMQRAECPRAGVGQQTWRFDLAPFLDSAQSRRSPSVLHFELEIAGLPGDTQPRRWPALSVTRAVAVKDLRLEFVSVGEHCLYELYWTDVADLRDLQVRFWSVWRPWDPPFELDLPAAAGGRHEFEAGADELLPGQYRLEVVVRDDWAPERMRRCPDPLQPGVLDVQTLTPEERLCEIDRMIAAGGSRYDLSLERTIVRLAAGESKGAAEDCQRCFDHLDKATIPQILALVEIAPCAADPDTVKALRMRMFGPRLLGEVRRARREGEISRERYDEYMAHRPHPRVLPEPSAVQLLEEEDARVRLDAAQALIDRGKPLHAVQAIVSWTETLAISDADAMALLSRQPVPCAEALFAIRHRRAAEHLLRWLGSTVLSTAHAGDWVECDLGWGRVEKIEHVESGTSVKWCVYPGLRFTLTITLRPAVAPEAAVVDLSVPPAGLVPAGQYTRCVWCDRFRTQTGQGLQTHCREAHAKKTRKGGLVAAKSSTAPFELSFIRFGGSPPSNQWT